MEVSYYVIVILCNFIKIYALYRIYNHIFKKNKYSVKIEALSFLLYAVFNSLLYFFVNIPVLNLFVNLSAYLLLTLNYKGEIKQKIFSAVFFCFLLVLVETIVVFVTASMPINLLDQNDYTFLHGHVFSAILVFLFAELFIHKKNIQNQIKLPVSHFIGLIVTPVSSYLIATYIMFLDDVTMNGIAICCILFLVINLAVFYLYDKIIVHVAQQKEHEQLLMQNRDYLYMIDNMKVSVENTRQLKHDLKNHAVALASLADAEKYSELKDYLQNIFQDVSGVYVDSGNSTIDSILNFKIQECKNKNIEFEPIVAIPNEMQVSNDILTVVLGNLLDNAIEATNKMKENRVIRMRIFFEVGMLYINIANPYDGTLKMKNGEYLTLKKDTKYHGYGLKNIQKAVDRNGGLLSVEPNEHFFIVNVILNTH